MLLKNKAAICYIADRSTISCDVFFRYKNNKYCIWQSLRNANILLYDYSIGDNIAIVDVNNCINLADAVSVLLRTAELNNKYLVFQE